MKVTGSANPNQEAIEAWNTVLFDKFVRFRHLVTVGLGTHGDFALGKHPPAPGARVLDLGCGFGDTAVELARRVGERGQVCGVDASERFIEMAQEETARAGVRNARFKVADVQNDDLGGPFDLAFSRFGVMFFANPVQAFRNVRRALAPDGRLCLVVWRKREDNAFIHTAEQVVRPLVPLPEQHDAPTCGPGPFSMADADVVTTVLLGAGFTDVTLERCDAAITIGCDLDEALAFAMAVGPAGEIIRLAGEEGEKRRPIVESALREALSRFVRPNGILAPSSTWIVTARRTEN